MHNKKYSELITKKLDGTLNMEEEKLLDTYLHNDNAADQEMHDLEKAMDTLAVLQEVEPPLVIKENVMARIDHQLYIQKASAYKSHWYDILLPSPKIGLAFACGLLLGLLMLTVVANIDYDNTGALYGTMGLKPEETMSVSSQIDLDNPQVRGSITILESGQNIFINNQVQSRVAGLQFQIRYEPQRLAFTGYKGDEQQSVKLENNDGLLTLQSAGENNTQLLFSKKSDEALQFNIRIIGDQETLLDKNVQLNPKKD